MYRKIPAKAMTSRQIECVCPVCQHRIRKPSGETCASVECPECGNPMTRAAETAPKEAETSTPKKDVRD